MQVNSKTISYDLQFTGKGTKEFTGLKGAKNGR